MSCPTLEKASWGTLNCAGYLTVTRTISFQRCISQFVICSGYPGFVIIPKEIPWMHMQTQPSLIPMAFGDIWKQLCTFRPVSWFHVLSLKQKHGKATLWVAWWSGLSARELEALACGFQAPCPMFNGENSLGDQFMVWASDEPAGRSESGLYLLLSSISELKVNIFWNPRTYG